MPDITQQLQAFGGVDAQTAAHILPEDRLATATNIDFSFENGAAVVRKGSRLHQTVNAFTPIHLIYRHYNNANAIDSSPYYYSGTDGTVYRVNGAGGTSTQVVTGSVGGEAICTSYKNHCYIVGDAGFGMKKDDGTTFTDWIKQAPAQPVITLDTSTPLDVATSYTVSEGSLTGGVGTATATTTGTNYRITFEATPPSSDLNSNGGDEIGDYGTDILSILISNPSLVSRISRDYSIGDANFTNFYHTEMDLQFNDVEEVLADPETLIEAEPTDGVTDDQLSNEQRDDMATTVRQAFRAPLTRVASGANTFNAWAVSRPNFEFVGGYTSTSGASGWANIQKVRVVIEASGPISVQVKDWQIKGSRSYPLNDVNVGYAWWQTFATYDADGNLMGESAPSFVSARYQCQFSRAVIVSTATATSNHGITHVHFYRQGGYLRDAYCVGTSSVSDGINGPVSTATFTDTLNDIQALANNKRLVTNLYSKTDFPKNFRAVSEPHYSRIFLIEENRLRWSLPGQPDCFPKTSVTQVSHEGDFGLGLIPWNNSLVIVNRDSVYEMYGNVFEGADANWTLQRTGSRHGTKCLRSVIKTPYGIPLVDYDGLYLYQPGQGIDAPIDWAMALMRDAFTGTGDADPASYKGDRIPAINISYIQDSVMAFANNRLYLAMPTGSSINPDVVFVLDFTTQRVWWYQYYTYVTQMFWDAVGNRLLAGTDDGQVMQLEYGTSDQNSLGATQPIGWHVKTRVWNVPSDTVVENAWVDFKGGPESATLGVGYDGAIPAAISTYTSTTRDWHIPALNGTFAQSIQFALTGTQTGTLPHALYQLGWDALAHPKRVQFFRTEHDLAGSESEKLWDVAISDIELVNETNTGTTTVLATTFLDEVAVMTNTFTHTASSGRQVYYKAFPLNSFGNVAYTIYRVTNTTEPHRFKLWGSKFMARPEPPRINSYKTDIQSLEENICDAVDVDIAPNGTTTSTVFVDNTAVSTFTLTGTPQQSYTVALPNELYGRTIYAIHQGNAFKHYKTWFHLRPEPDRWTNFVSSRQTSDEQWFSNFNVDANCLGNIVLATAYVDNTATATYTMTGSGRRSYVHTLPRDTYGRIVHTVYNVQSGGKFKFFGEQYVGTPEPDRLSTVQSPVQPFPSNQHLKTWIAELNPLGTCTGTLYADNTVLTTSTFVGSYRQRFEVGLDVDTSLIPREAKTLRVVYSSPSGSVMKHYSTQFETEAQPFGKRTWMITYNKIGGATQLDMARFWSIEAEAQSGTALATCIWDVDGRALSTSTLTISTQAWQDRIPFPPDGRGYIFQLRVLANAPIRVYKSNLDTVQVGIKGLVRHTTPGTPQ